MYLQIVIKWLKKCKKVNLPPLKDKESLINILKNLFKFEDQEIIGFTDNNGKFYDILSFFSHLQEFHKQTIDLVTSTAVNNDNNQNHQYELGSFPVIEDQNQFNIEPISFASNTPNEFENDYNPLNNDSELYQHFELPEQAESEVIAEIHDLKIFEQMFLDDEITIVVESSKRQDHLSFPHYHLKGKNKRIYIYQYQKKVCQLPLQSENWKDTENVVLNVLKSFEKLYSTSQQSQKESNEANFFATEPQINIIHERRGSVPSQEKNRTSRKHSKRESKEQTKGAFQKQKNEDQRKFNNFFSKKQSRSQQSSEPQRYDIPIIIRKSNNQIQKVTASYPLSHQQMQAINSLLELEIQGLFTDEEINKVKMMVLGENDGVLKIFQAYGKQKMNLSDLSKSLAVLVRKKEPIRK